MEALVICGLALSRAATHDTDLSGSIAMSSAAFNFRCVSWRSCVSFVFDVFSVRLTSIGPARTYSVSLLGGPPLAGK